MGKKVLDQNQINDIIMRYTKKIEPISLISKIYECDSSVIKRLLIKNNIEIIKGSAFSVQFWIKRGLSDDEARLKVKKMKPSLIEYWLDKGFDEEQSKIQTELHLMNTERAFKIKYGEKEGKLKYIEKKKNEGIKYSTRRKEYWVERGYSNEEAITKVKEVQSTFSLKKCVEKYGEEKGLKIFNDRQEKWKNSLKNRKDYFEIQKRKESKSLKKIMERHPENYVKVYFEQNLYRKNFHFLYESVYKNNYILFLDEIKNNLEYDSKKILSISKVKLFQFIFNKSEIELKTDINKLYNIKNKQSYGTTFIINGVIVRSLGEKKIFEKLTELNIDFIYDGFYPKQKKYKFDFYIPKYDIYLEYFGMLNVKTTEKNEKIIRTYKIKCEDKKKLCLSNNLKFLFSNNTHEILRYINNLIYDTKTNND